MKHTEMVLKGEGAPQFLAHLRSLLSPAHYLLEEKDGEEGMVSVTCVSPPDSLAEIDWWNMERLFKKFTRPLSTDSGPEGFVWLDASAKAVYEKLKKRRQRELDEGFESKIRELEAGRLTSTLKNPLRV